MQQCSFAEMFDSPRDALPFSSSSGCWLEAPVESESSKDPYATKDGRHPHSLNQPSEDYMYV